MKHLEIEMKTLQYKEEYQRLQGQFSEIHQLHKNYYLDTPDFLSVNIDCHAHSYIWKIVPN